VSTAAFTSAPILGFARAIEGHERDPHGGRSDRRDPDLDRPSSDHDRRPASADELAGERYAGTRQSDGLQRVTTVHAIRHGVELYRERAADARAFVQ